MAKMRLLKLAALALLIAGGLYASTLIDETSVDRLTARVGIWGPVVIGAFILFTQVCAPLSGTPGLFIAIKLYGYPQAMFLFYVVSMASAALNFLISRFFGRPVVRRLIGVEGVRHVEELTHADERTLLVTARLFGYYFFDFISYAAGLTRLRFAKYMAYTATLTLVPLGIQYYLFRDLDVHRPVGAFLYYGSVVATGLIFARIFYKLVARRRSASTKHPRPARLG